MRLALFVLLGVSTAHAQPAKIDAVMKPWTGSSTPGCAVAVVERGRVTFAKGYGMADLERNVPITAATVFDTGSLAKQFTAATIHLLAAAGKLKLDDDIRTYVPQLPVVSKTPVTIRHLLHHTGGLREYNELLTLGGKQPSDVATSTQTLAALTRQRGNAFEPGAKFEYSNTGYFLLAQVAERVAKKSMAGLVAERIFKPLGMTSSQVLDDHTRIVPRRAIAYAPRGSGWSIEMSQWEQTGDGGVLSTVDDLVKWDANFTEKKVGGATLTTALKARGKLASGKELDYGSGLFHGTYRGQPTIHHSGGWAGYRAQLLRFPKLRGSVVVLCNAANADPVRLSHEIADVVFELQLGPKGDGEAVDVPADKPVELTSSELDAWVGSYRDVVNGAVVTVKRDGKALVVAAGAVMPLIATSKTVFRLGTTPLVIEFSGTRPKRAATLEVKDQQQRLVEVVTLKPSAAELAPLAGRYWSTELQVMWTISIANGAAVIDGPNLEAVPLEFTSPTEAGNSAAGFALAITKTPRGVTGFTLAGGLHGVRFDRL